MYKITGRAVACVLNASRRKRLEIAARGSEWLATQSRETDVYGKMPYISVLASGIMFSRTEDRENVIFTIPLEPTIL